MNKSVYLGLSILEISKTLMYEFWYDYMKPKYQDTAKLCYMDTDTFLQSCKKQKMHGGNSCVSKSCSPSDSMMTS